jgi:hypothetical protein
VRALKAPSNNLESNWAYMVIAMLAWCLKAWMALLLPEPAKSKPAQNTTERSTKHKRCGQAAEKLTLFRMEFRQFVDYLIRIPTQIIRGARRITYRLLNYNPWQITLFRILDVIGG